MTDRQSEALAILRRQVRMADILGPVSWQDFRDALKRKKWPSDAKLSSASWRNAWRHLRVRLIIGRHVEEDRRGYLTIND